MSEGRIILPGKYVCDGNVPIIVVDDGTYKDGMHGPWVRYRFPWETDDAAKPVYFEAFYSLMDIGYRLEGAT